MKKYIMEVEERLNNEIQIIDLEEIDIFQRSMRIITILENAFEDLKSFILSYNFKDISEEISFFKEIKPQLFSILIYYRKIYNLEMRMPTGGKLTKKNI